jgi:hypothetical protein
MFLTTENKKASPFWYFSKGIPPKVCDVLIEEFITLGLDKPNCNMFISPKGHWFTGSLANYGKIANGHSEWNFSLKDSENLIFLGLEQPNIFEPLDDNEFLPGFDIIDRNSSKNSIKISVICQLSEKESMGIYLEGHEEKLLTNRGDIVAFPSYKKVKFIRPEVTDNEKNFLIRINLYGDYFK